MTYYLATIAPESEALEKIEYKHIVEDFIWKHTKRKMLFENREWYVQPLWFQNLNPSLQGSPALALSEKTDNKN